MRIPFTDCPLCGSASLEADFRAAAWTTHERYRAGITEDMIRWSRCRDCGHVFTSGYFDETLAEQLFSSARPGQCPQLSAGYLEARRPAFARIVTTVSQLRGSHVGRWLDVGFGDGVLLLVAAEFGYDVVGVDTSAECAEALTKIGIDARTGSIDAIASQERFDVISFADSLEHIVFPRVALQQARSLLNAGGALFLSTPNLDAPLWRLLDDEGLNPYWGEIEHYHIFGLGRLRALLRECGFEARHYSVSERYRVCMELVAVLASADANHSNPACPPGRQ